MTSRQPAVTAEMEALVEGVPVVVLADADREAVAESLADMLLAALIVVEDGAT